MRRFATTAIMGALMACGGGGGDTCQQGVSLLQSEDAKIKSCGDSPNEEATENAVAADITSAQTDEQSCETGLKSCTPAEMSTLSSFVSCEQSVVAELQCTWFTEADVTTDPSYQKYQSDGNACLAKLDSVSAACKGD